MSPRGRRLRGPQCSSRRNGAHRWCLGAVGRAATQIARWKKTRVIASTNSDNPSNADALINTTTHDLDREVHALTEGRGADLVLDAVGGPGGGPSTASHPETRSPANRRNVVYILR
jgi:threonine dehydrogenase-like Zn-dependent dehydrogenase